MIWHLRVTHQTSVLPSQSHAHRKCEQSDRCSLTCKRLGFPGVQVELQFFLSAGHFEFVSMVAHERACARGAWEAPALCDTNPLSFVLTWWLWLSQGVVSASSSTLDLFTGDGLLPGHSQTKIPSPYIYETFFSPNCYLETMLKQVNFRCSWATFLSLPFTL